jgi:hypothetical protein
MYFTLVSFSASSPTMKLEETYSFETSVDFLRTTRNYIPEDRTRHKNGCRNSIHESPI